MNALTKPDLNRLPVDEQAFLARALELGVRLRRLPEPLLDALNAYLQGAAFQHARRFRTGIKVRAEDLSRGVRRIAVCLDAGLKAEAQDDLNAALDLLLPDRFEALRKRGWEIVHAHLIEMQKAAVHILKSPYRGLLKGDGSRLRRWATICADDCSAEDADGAREEMDLVAEFAAFRRVELQARFLASLPRPLVRGLPEAQRRSWGFEEVVQAVILALATEGQDLVLNDQATARLRDLCDVDGALNAGAREKVERLLRGHLLAHSDEEEYLVFILNAARTAMEKPISAPPRAARKAVDEIPEK
jgi:hypothetical protein